MHSEQFRIYFKKTLITVTFFAILGCLWPVFSFAAPFRISVLMIGDIRNGPLEGFKKGMHDLDFVDGKTISLDIHNANGDRAALPQLARTIVKRRPKVAIACGGLEADALQAASRGTTVPVVFLAVAAAVERGLVASLQQPGGNLTGVDTYDAQLIGKRLWFIRQMFPEIKRVIIPHVTSVPPSVTSVAVARVAAADLGLDLNILAAPDKETIQARAAALSKADGEVICILPVAPVWQIEQTVLFRVSKEQRIPMMGVNRGDLEKGAVAAYACSRFDAGVQAARLVKKILSGTPPRDIPVETPTRLEFVINKKTVDLLGLKLPRRAWRLADEVVSIEVR